MKKAEQILITGTFRSGTTLIAQMMKNHPNIEMVYDSVNFMRFSYGRYDPLKDFKNIKALVKEIHERIETRWNMHFDYKKVLNKLEKEEQSYRLIYDTLMKELLLSNSDANVWGEKTTLVWTKIPDFFKMFPNGGVIHIIRDPRAVLGSWREMTNTPGCDYLDAIINCRGSMEQMQQYKKIFRKEGYVPIRFEDLVINPEKCARKICAKLGLEFSLDMLDASSFTDKSGKLWRGNSMFKEKLNKISKNTINIWEEFLADWEIWLTELLITEFMDNFGYKRKNIELNENSKNEILHKIQSSKLLTNGLLNFLLKKKGMERFPTDPLDSKNWD